jgi:putative ATP-binding cassette transporter
VADVSVQLELTSRRIAARFLRVGLAYWRGRTARRAWALTLGLAVVTFALVGFVVLINNAMALFFNALERKDASALGAALVEVAIVGTGAALSYGLVTWIKQSLQIGWREFLTKRLLGMWAALGSSHHVVAWGRDVDMPEFRIAEDVRMSVDALVDFATSLLNATITAVAFIAVLWTVGGAIVAPIGGGMAIPGYMVWIALLYAIVMSSGISFLGRPLVEASERKNAAEASLRADMVKLGDVPVEVSLQHGDRRERVRVVRDVERLFARWRTIVRYQAEVAVLGNANVTLMPLVPLLAAAPKYISGDLTLGAVMQLGAAFAQTQYAFNWFFDNYVRIAEWLANAVRVVKLIDAMEAQSRDDSG